MIASHVEKMGGVRPLPSRTCVLSKGTLWAFSVVPVRFHVKDSRRRTGRRRCDPQEIQQRTRERVGAAHRVDALFQEPREEVQERHTRVDRRVQAPESTRCRRDGRLDAAALKSAHVRSSSTTGSMPTTYLRHAQVERKNQIERRIGMRTATHRDGHLRRIVGVGLGDAARTSTGAPRALVRQRPFLEGG